MTDSPTTLLICCGAVAREIVALVNGNGWDHMKVECLPASIHNSPEDIPEAVREKIRDARGRFERILVLFSDCGTGGMLDAVLDEERVERIDGSHCFEVFAGTDAFAAMMKAEPGSFFVTDFLARHFERLVIEGLGLDRFPQLRSAYFGKYKRLVYLAQSDDPELMTKARGAAQGLGLEFEARFTGYGDFRKFLTAHSQA